MKLDYLNQASKYPPTYKKDNRMNRDRTCQSEKLLVFITRLSSLGYQHCCEARSWVFSLTISANVSNGRIGICQVKSCSIDWSNPQVFKINFRTVARHGANCSSFSQKFSDSSSSQKPLFLMTGTSIPQQIQLIEVR